MVFSHGFVAPCSVFSGWRPLQKACGRPNSTGGLMNNDAVRRIAMESDFKTPVKNWCFFWGKTLNMIEASPFFRKTMPFLLERKNGELPNWFWPIQSWLNKFISWISQYVDQENRQLTINQISHGLPVVYWWFGDDHYCWTNFESFDFHGNI